MFKFNARTLALFLTGYGLHAFALLALDASPLTTGLALAGLLLAVIAIWADLRRLDEVQRGFALTACAISFIATAILSYLRNLPDMPALVGENALWTVALAIWLVSYGVLQWRAR